MPLLDAQSEAAKLKAIQNSPTHNKPFRSIQKMSEHLIETFKPEYVKSSKVMKNALEVFIAFALRELMTKGFVNIPGLGSLRVSFIHVPNKGIHLFGDKEIHTRIRLDFNPARKLKALLRIQDTESMERLFKKNAEAERAAKKNKPPHHLSREGRQKRKEAVQ